MKKMWFLPIVLFIIAISGLVLIYPNFKAIPPICAKAGEYIRTGFSPIPRERECCKGLDELITGIDTDPLCSDCGNGRCEDWENTRNCSEDCE